MDEMDPLQLHPWQEQEALLLEMLLVQIVDTMAKELKEHNLPHASFCPLPGCSYSLLSTIIYMEISSLKYFFLHYLAVQIPASAALSYRPAISML